MIRLFSPRARRVIALLAIAFALSPAPPVGAAPGDASAVGDASPTADAVAWAWPGGLRVVVRAYEPPAHAYGPGHRGVDLGAGGVIVAPADGVVAFSGSVAGRPLVTIDHGGGLVSTLEPVAGAPPAGTAVARGQEIGELAEGGHARAGTVHLGARLDGAYINPLALLGAAERPVLLPCC
ncbi:murein hydrolase activator EnvC [Microbacterium sp. ZXX196]|uniref:murein hydrolase activator EnvC family protein n=1 Tax=Microbacterium sp. ZXX196 TaxID=2609291 RepID=UPI0012B6E156|nr:M23 family metallopeptidase [Microbacterium sp. ZXX196]MTE23685.1 peptidoglycan DD-metalloendopeptidase family protein [Microbacterium sp. ZXX196]